MLDWLLKGGPNWSTNVWHRRLVQWTYGEGVFYSEFHQAIYGKYFEEIIRQPKQINLCPYMRRMVIAIAAAPFLYVFRLLDKKVWAQVLFITSTFNLIGAVPLSVGFRISYLLALEYAVAATLGAAGVLGLLIGLLVLKDKIGEWGDKRRNAKWEKMQKAFREGTYTPKAKGPNPVLVYIRAVHDKVCPQIVWVEELPKPSAQEATTTPPPTA